MDRRDFFKAVGISTAAFLASQADAKRLVSSRAAAIDVKTGTPVPPSTKPNIIWFTFEDISPDLGCYGNSIVKTPNMDKLASEGMRFTNTFVTCPVCSPSRSAFMTGMYATTIGAHNHRSHETDGYLLPAPAKLIMEYFRQAGYYTCNVKNPATGIKFQGKTDYNFTYTNNVFDGWRDWTGRKPGQPFFAHINFKFTHRDFTRDTVNPIDPTKVEFPPYYPDHKVTRRDWADYLESIQLLDGQVGKVLKRIDDEGLTKNTIIFIFGDHGQCHLRGKQWLYDSGIKIPLIARWPDHIEAGSVNNELVSAIDFAPTCFDLAGIPVPAHMQGQIFLGKNKKNRTEIFAARDRCDGTVDRIRCVRTKQYKYIKNFYPERPYTQFNGYKYKQYPVLTLLTVLNKQGKLTPAQAKFMAPTRPAEELYDIIADPFEINNLAGQPAHEATLTELRNKVTQWITDTDDKGQTPEPESVTKAEYDAMMQTIEADMIARGLSMQTTPEDYLAWWETHLGV